MERVTYAIDTESYYDDDVSIGTLGVRRYVRETEHYMVSIAGSDGFEWVGPPQEAPWEKIKFGTWIAHNAAYDVRVVAHVNPYAGPLYGWHCSADLAAFIQSPRRGEVYNLGGGRQNSCSILEAFERIERISGKKMIYRYLDQPREADHICYISDLSKIRSHFPDWRVTKSLDDIFSEIYDSWKMRGT